MYFLCSKISLETETADCDINYLRQASNKLASKFKVIAKSGFSNADPDAPFIAVTTIGSDRAQLSDLVDKMSEYIETLGIGRILNDYTAIESVDLLEDDDEE